MRKIEFRFGLNLRDIGPHFIRPNLPSYKTRSKGYAHFSVVTGEPPPIRYGVIQYTTAKDYNDAEIGIG